MPAALRAVFGLVAVAITAYRPDRLAALREDTGKTHIPPVIAAAWVLGYFIPAVTVIGGLVWAVTIIPNLDLSC